jgi:hypothetical protein
MNDPQESLSGPCEGPDDETRRFFFAVLRRFINPDGPDPVPVPNRWSHALDRVVARQMLGPIFLYVLGDRGRPEAVGQTWRRQQETVFTRNALAAEGAGWLFRILSEEKIRALAMRGLPLAYTLYPQPCLRPMTDVDVLIDAGDRFAVEEALAKHGLRPTAYRRSQIVYEIRGILFEIHYSLLTPKRYRSAVCGEALLADARPVPAGPMQVSAVSPEYELYIGIVHNFTHHDLGRVLGLVDAGLLIRSRPMDWAKVYRIFCRSRMERVLRFTLSFANRLLDLGLDKAGLPFEIETAEDAQRYFPAYENRFFGPPTVRDILMVKRNLLRMSQTPRMKMGQLIRLLSADEIGRFWAALRNKEP